MHLHWHIVKHLHVNMVYHSPAALVMRPHVADGIVSLTIHPHINITTLTIKSKFIVNVKVTIIVIVTVKRYKSAYFYIFPCIIERKTVYLQPYYNNYN